MTRKPNIYRYVARIRVPKYGGEGDIPALLDMLRYESATVDSWSIVRSEDQIGVASFVVTIRSERPVPDRWESFGIKLTYPESTIQRAGGRSYDVSLEPFDSMTMFPES